MGSIQFSPTADLVDRRLVTWRYLTGTRSRVKHAVWADGSPVGHTARAVCGLEAWSPQAWRGTGSQAEYEQAARLPECRRCVRWLTPEAAACGMSESGG